MDTDVDVLKPLDDLMTYKAWGGFEGSKHLPLCTCIMASESYGFFVAYAGLDNVEDKFNVPMFGNRDILRWEAERELERKLLVEGNVRIPYKYDSPEDIDRAVMVKFPGARGGRGYFVASSFEEFNAKIDAMKARGWRRSRIRISKD